MLLVTDAPDLAVNFVLLERKIGRFMGLLILYIVENNFCMGKTPAINSYSIFGEEQWCVRQRCGS